MDKNDEVLNTNQYPIYAGASNLKEIKYNNIKQGYFMYVFNKGKSEIIKDWPLVDFYYASDVSDLENEYLSNIDDWPIIHRSVMEEFKKNKIEGIQYLPIDMKKSEYIHDEEDGIYTFFPHATYFIQEKCKEYDIFKCTKIPVGIYVSDKIKKIFDDNKWDWFLLRKQKMIKEKNTID